MTRTSAFRKIKRSLIGLILLIGVACDKPTQKAYFERQTLARITNLAAIEPPPPIYSFTPVFALCMDDSIVVTNFSNLEQVYTTAYTGLYTKFSDFLYDLLNQKLKLNTEDKSVRPYYSNKFKVDQEVSSLYKKENIHGLIDKYTNTKEDGFRLRRMTLSVNEINSISYYFFLNQFIRYDDDYHATIQFRKLSM